MNIYLTAEDKKELERKISYLERKAIIYRGVMLRVQEQLAMGKISALKELLSQAIILPVLEKTDELYRWIKVRHANGVIIKPKGNDK